MTPEQQSLRQHNMAIVPSSDASYKWECPARYEVFHKHADGRPLCQFCQYWNPAPFPDGRLPRQATEHRQSGSLHLNSESEAFNSVSGTSLSFFVIDPTKLSKYNSFCRQYQFESSLIQY